VKSALDLVESMYLHQLTDTAVAKSRLAGAGIVFWPTNAPDIPIAAGEEPVPGSRQAMLRAFEDIAWDSITKQASREAVIPAVVFYEPGADGVQYKPEMFRIERDDLADQYAKRVETHMGRLASALELPMESVAGMSGAGRWTAYQIDVDKWKTWFASLCELIRVELEKRCVKVYGEQYSLVLDPSELIAKPDQTDVIIKLAQLDMATPESVQSALVSGRLEDLVMQDPPPRDYRSNVAPGQPSDFGNGETNRGGGQYRDKP
jgi:hypothetical protein